MFGEQITFNVNGDTNYNTCCGVMFTIAIIFFTVVLFFTSYMQGASSHDVPTILTQVKEEYFPAGRGVYQVRQDNPDEPFAFAIAVTSHSDFAGKDYSQSGRFRMSYKIVGGPDNGKAFNIGFRRCTDADWSKFHPASASDR